MEIYLIRHTQPDIQRGICYGQSDIPLGEDFIQSAEIIKQNLSDLAFDQVFSSPLIRCKMLADKLFDSFTTSSLLIEMNFGKWEGTAWDDIFKDDDGREWFENYLTHPCPDGESFIDLQKRVKKFVESLNFNHQKIALVTHAGIIRAFRMIYENLKPDTIFSEKIQFGEISIINLKYH